MEDSGDGVDVERRSGGGVDTVIEEIEMVERKR